MHMHIHEWQWLPGDIPLSKERWHGPMAGDSNMEPGILAGAEVCVCVYVCVYVCAYSSSM